MRKLTNWTGLAAADRGASVAIGNFDGVHLGHQHVLDLARAASGPDRPLGVVTFEPHPRQVFAPHLPPFRLMNPEARENRLARLGVERLYELSFDAALRSLSPEDFAADVLSAGLGVSHVVVGQDFCFGKGRAGSAQDLVSLGQKHGFDVTIAPLVQQSAQQISSSAIRAALSAGDPRLAASMLGHWHRIEGPVIKGDQRGRDLGFPTANMSIAGLHPPRFGIYAVFADVLTGPHRGSYFGAANIGTRPMFDGEVPNLETYLFDFSGNLYGEHLSVALVDFLRPEAKFDSLEALIAQMDADCRKARQILEAERAAPDCADSAPCLPGEGAA